MADINRKEFLKLGFTAVAGAALHVAVGKPSAAEAGTEAAKKPEIPLNNKVEIPVPHNLSGLQVVPDINGQNHIYGSIPEAVEPGGNELYEVDDAGNRTRVASASSRQFAVAINRDSNTPSNPSGIEELASLTPLDGTNTNYLHYRDKPKGFWLNVGRSGVRTEQPALLVKRVPSQPSQGGEVLARMWLAKVQLSNGVSCVYVGAKENDSSEASADQNKPLKDPKEWLREQISFQLDKILDPKNQLEDVIPDPENPIPSRQRQKVRTIGAKEMVRNLLGGEARQGLNQEQIIKLITNKLMQEYQKTEAGGWVEAPNTLLSSAGDADLQTIISPYSNVIYALYSPNTDRPGEHDEMYLQRGFAKMGSDGIPYIEWDWFAMDVAFSEVMSGSCKGQSLTVGSDGVVHVIYRKGNQNLVSSLDYSNRRFPVIYDDIIPAGLPADAILQCARKPISKYEAGKFDLQVFAADPNRNIIQPYILSKDPSTSEVKFKAENYTYKLNGKPVEFKVIVNPQTNKFEAQAVIDKPDGQRVVEIIPLELVDQLPRGALAPFAAKGNVPSLLEEHPSGPEIGKSQP